MNRVFTEKRSGNTVGRSRPFAIKETQLIASLLTDMTNNDQQRNETVFVSYN